MNTIELTKILALLQTKCSGKNGLHNTFLITDSKHLEVKVWREYKNKTTTVFDKAVLLTDTEKLKNLLLDINGALNEICF